MAATGDMWSVHQGFRWVRPGMAALWGSLSPEGPLCFQVVQCDSFPTAERPTGPTGGDQGPMDIPWRPGLYRYAV
jgi:hypothetical protein